MGVKMGRTKAKFRRTSSRKVERVPKQNSSAGRGWIAALVLPSLLAGFLLLVPLSLAAQTATGPPVNPPTETLENPGSPITGLLERPEKPTVDQNFALWTGMTVALTIADIELTQHCLHKHRCREGNPLLTGSRPRAYAIGLGTAAGFSYLGYRLKKKEELGESTFLRWWYPQLMLGVGHGGGIVGGFRLSW